MPNEEWRGWVNFSNSLCPPELLLCTFTGALNHRLCVLVSAREYDALQAELAETKQERDKWYTSAASAMLLVPDDIPCGVLKEARDSFVAMQTELAAARAQLAEAQRERDLLVARWPTEEKVESHTTT